MNIRYLHILFSLALLLALCGSATAQFDRPPFAQPGPNAATVVGAPGAKARDLYEVRFIAIDGQQINPREAIWLEPGTYELTVSIRADFGSSAPTGLRRRQAPGYNTIEVELEAGKQYFILARYHRSGEDAGQYSVILHRVQE
jgi:hypothetical protein